MMKRLTAYLASAALSISPVQAGINHGSAGAAPPPPTNKYLVYSGCTQPPDTNAGPTYYVKATGGSDSNNGLTVGTAFATINHAFSVGGSGGGYTILLEGGSWGAMSLSGHSLSAFVTIKADSGQTPLFTSVLIQNSSKIIIEGLKVQATKSSTTPLLFVNDYNGAVSDVVFYGNDVSSAPFATVSTWTATDWTNNARTLGFETDSSSYTGNINATMDVNCVALNNNSFKYLQQGFVFQSNSSVADSNTLDWIAGDYMDVAGSNALISNNTGTNSLVIGGNHNDFFQGQRGRCDLATYTSCTYSNITVTGNTQIELADTAANVPLTTYNGASACDGITFFDMDWVNVIVTNNVILNSSNWGIGIKATTGGLVGNNTVINIGTSGTSMGVQVDKNSNQGLTNTSGVEVLNNLTAMVLSDAHGIQTMHDNMATNRVQWYEPSGTLNTNTAPGSYTNPAVPPNINNVVTSASLSTIFTTIDTTNGIYDMHLKAGSPAIGAGTATRAPNKRDGTARTGTVDLGAY